MSNASSPPLENPIILNLNSSFGTQLIGAVFSSALWGISCMQMFMYFLNYPQDRWTLKAFVAYLWALDTVIEALTFVSMWPPLISQWGSVTNLEASKPVLIHRSWLAGILAFSVQVFLLYRIYRFAGKTSWLVRSCFIAVVVIAVYQIIGVILYTVWVLTDLTTVVAALASRRNMLITTTIRAVTAFTDILIAVWMTVLLSDKARSPFGRSNRLVYRIIFMTINTGMWTALIAFVDLILLAKANRAFSVFEYPLAALYLNMCFANLNARRFLRDGRAGPTISALAFDRVSMPSTNATVVHGVPPAGVIPLQNMSRGMAVDQKEESMTIRIDTSSATRPESDAESMEMPNVKADLVDSAC